MSYSLRCASLFALFTLPVAAGTPQLHMAGNGVIAAPFIPGGTVVSALYRAPGEPWIALELAADSDILGIGTLQATRDDWEVWNFPLAQYTATEACVYGVDQAGADNDGAPCAIERTSDGATLAPGHVLTYDLDDGVNVLAASAFVPAESLGYLAVALVLDDAVDTWAELQFFDEADALFGKRSLDLAEAPTGDVAVRAWSHDGVPRMSIVDDSSWWINGDVLGIQAAKEWVKPCPSHVMSAPDSSTLRVAQLGGDTAGTQRVSVQNDDQFIMAEFVDVDDMTCSATNIPGPEGVVATEIDGDWGLYSLLYERESDQWSAALVQDGAIVGYGRFGDLSLTGLDDDQMPSDLRDLGPAVAPDNWHALGGNAFISGDPDRPVILGGGAMTVSADETAAVMLTADPDAASSYRAEGKVAALRVQVADGGADLTAEAAGERSLVVLSGSDPLFDVADLASYFTLPGYGDVGLARMMYKIRELVGDDLDAGLDAAAVIEPGAIGANQTLVVGSGTNADFTTGSEAGDLVGVGVTLGFSDYGGNASQVDVSACSNYIDLEGGFYGLTSGLPYIDLEGGFYGFRSDIPFHGTAGTVVGESDDDTISWSLISSDADTPLYDTVLNMMSSQCGGVGCYLAAAESTELATRNDVTATFMVNNVIAAGNSGSRFNETAHGYIVWSGTDNREGVPGISLSGNGDVTLVVTAIDHLTGARTEVLDTSLSFRPEVDDEVILGVLDTGFTLEVGDSPSKLSVGTFEDGFSLQISYTLSSADGELVTLKNGVGFGFSLDSDGDGLFDDEDDCPDSAEDALIDASGCSIDDYCPCDDGWSSHGDYVSCVTQAANDFKADGLISGSDKGAITKEAAGSACGTGK